MALWLQTKAREQNVLEEIEPGRKEKCSPQIREPVQYPRLKIIYKWSHKTS